MYDWLLRYGDADTLRHIVERHRVDLNRNKINNNSNLSLPLSSSASIASPSSSSSLSSSSSSLLVDDSNIAKSAATSKPLRAAQRRVEQEQSFGRVLVGDALALALAGCAPLSAGLRRRERVVFLSILRWILTKFSSGPRQDTRAKVAFLVQKVPVTSNALHLVRHNLFFLYVSNE